jgi:hypothetical protein
MIPLFSFMRRTVGTVGIVVVAVMREVLIMGFSGIRTKE